jgi:hypothetical protein
MYKKCSICEKDISSDIYNNYFCKECYLKYKEQILGKEPWVRFLVNWEHNRRRRKKQDVIYTGEGYDITEDGELVFLYTEG